MKIQWFQVLFYEIQKCLNEFFSPGKDVPFGEESVLVCGDLCQLSPVHAKPVFTFDDTETMEALISMNLWHKFRFAELDQVMRQDYEIFLNMLNKIRIDEIDQNIDRFIGKNGLHYPGRILYIFAENAPVKRQNDNQLKDIPG